MEKKKRPAKKEEKKKEEKKKPAKKKPTPRPPKQPKPSGIFNITPTNMIEQRDIFYANNCEINPTFEYRWDVSTRTSIFTPEDTHLDTAKRIIETCLGEFSGYSAYFESDGGPLMNKKEVQDYFDWYMAQTGLDTTVTISFSERALAPMSVVHNGQGSHVTCSVPIVHRPGRISGALHHEIGTHLTRKINDRHQPWYKKRDKFSLKDCTMSEEGMACVHTLLPAAWDESRKPYLLNAAMQYYACYWASRLSFVDLYNDLKRYIDDENRLWKQVVRVKKGLVDTSQPGGYYKDQMYLKGAVIYLSRRHELDLHRFYWGKLSFEDFDRPDIQKRIKMEDLKYPLFFKDMELYMQAIDRIAETNQL